MMTIITQTGSPLRLLFCVLPVCVMSNPFTPDQILPKNNHSHFSSVFFADKVN